VLTAALFAEQAAIVLGNAEAYTRAQDAALHLGEALTSRAVIDMAKGIVMAREPCGPDEAFGRLRHLSQVNHRKLRDIAQEIVDQVAGDGAGQPPET